MRSSGVGTALQKCHDLRQAGQTSALTGLWSDFWRDELSAANTAGMGAAGGGAGTSIQVMLASGQGRPSGHSFQFFPSSSNLHFDVVSQFLKILETLSDF